MMSGRVGRRAFLAIGAGALLTGCATAYGDNPAIPVIRRVEVSGHGNLWLERMPAYVQRNLVQQLGSRYQPGAKGGATLEVALTSIDFPVDSDAGLISLDSTDSLDGRVRLVSSAGRVLKSFPMFASTTSVDAASEIPDPTPRRYDWLASSYAHWLLGKLA
ncbi:hypothetical protein [Labrys neptuniae]